MTAAQRAGSEAKRPPSAPNSRPSTVAQELGARLKPAFVLDAFAGTVPLCRVHPEQIEEIRAWGRERAVPAGRAVTTAGAGAATPSRRIVFRDE
ncbi:hypothetical protein ACIHCM_28785 [Streptomyces sp. NPDC052023]|uniref:hypothetical protein n=1 Tax=Streptomyces sp. NPDC052023 TaxID=3365681 RepID=UPI0037D6A3CF